MASAGTKSGSSIATSTSFHLVCDDSRCSLPTETLRASITSSGGRQVCCLSSLQLPVRLSIRVLRRSCADIQSASGTASNAITVSTPASSALSAINRYGTTTTLPTTAATTLSSPYGTTNGYSSYSPSPYSSYSSYGYAPTHRLCHSHPLNKRFISIMPPPKLFV